MRCSIGNIIGVWWSDVESEWESVTNGKVDSFDVDVMLKNDYTVTELSRRRENRFQSILVGLGLDGSTMYSPIYRKKL